ncbi:glutamine--fructose-6-phosphate transaminase (isomerizing) [Pelagicoccus sp. SDUM812003]|uniref:glutamine--fructose-6-phosphate transaminase (isomerizing) n=1 Tax=Pelagicoccus sp. SDUM812003 TaxID=3041267 RepID=UPI00280CABF5|nr:glutamine--fructose-6-phosphate transaminase (isomerizing) [Pelagicoccus sp. SDUM812003]MDQ8205197.1 glutamine--fructose-6-phosphate transaminase (isomerizing) [Pelagicoccus sp. SDUM812003]
MCGIVGYIGNDNAAPILLNGLKRLEYRGYDSAGMAVWQKDRTIKLIKRTGKVSNLAACISIDKEDAGVGISHTRWATHGGVTEANTHPHVSWDQQIHLVHNGVIENYQTLKNSLESKGVTFYSETDSEILANLIAYNLQQLDGEITTKTVYKAILTSLTNVEGTYGLAIMCASLPGTLFGARKGSPLILGVGKNEMMLASDASAIRARTNEVVYLDDNQIVTLTEDNFSITTIEEAEVVPEISTISWKDEDAELQGFEHFMLKEIYDQPAALENAFRGRLDMGEGISKFGGLNLSRQDIRRIDRITIVACGTAWHAGLVGEYLIEKYSRIPVEVEYASEFRYRNTPMDKNTLVIVISQSGETIDTLEAQREAQRKGYHVIGIVNNVGSTIARENDGGIYQHSGPEIGVASTKAFTSQLLILAMLSIYLGRTRDLSYTDGCQAIKAVMELPNLVKQTLQLADSIKGIAKKFAHYDDFLFLGRLEMFPIALEGALKLKEISYIHAEGYPAAEMKHGPIALISEKCPSIVIVPDDETLKKNLSSVQEVRARNGKVIIITDSNEIPSSLADELIIVPKAHDCVRPVLMTIPLQLLSYYIALELGRDVDKPRNLAKSVTVE